MHDKLMVELLDSDLGHAIQSWEVDLESITQIGRSPDSDVVIRNPYVSRCHAYVTREPQGWVVNSISDLGLVVEGKVVQSITVSGETTFRLSRKGPSLRVRLMQTEAEDSLTGMETISENAYAFPLLLLDESKRDSEVDEIAKADYFTALKEIALHKRTREHGSS